MSSKRDAWVGVLVIALVVFITFASATGNDFVRWDDDDAIFHNAQILDPTWASIFKAWDPRQVSVVYQPITHSFLAATALLAKLDVPDPSICESGALLDPHVFHWMSLVLHIVDCLLVYALLLKLVPDRPIFCAAGALLFGLHPLQVESVAWASGVDRLINALFALSALLAYVFAAREPYHPRRNALYVAAIALGMIAYLAKPVAITLPMAALLIDRFILRRDWKMAITWYVPWQMALIPLYLLSHAVTPNQNLSVTPLWTRPCIAGDALAWHMFKFILPFHLGIDYGRQPQYVLTHWWGFATWLIPAALIAVAYLCRRNGWLVAAVGLWLAALLPDVGLVPFPFQYYSTVADRYDYFALLGPALAAAILLSNARWRHSATVAAAVLVLLAAISSAQVLSWANTPTLMAQTISVNPRSSIARLSLGVYNADHGQVAKAMQLYRTAVELNPLCYEAHANLGGIYAMMGRRFDAEEELRQAIAIKPDEKSPHYNLARLRFDEGRYTEAVAEYRKALSIDPSDIPGRGNLALCLAANGQTANALSEIRAVLKSDPNFAPALNLEQSLNDGTFKAGNSRP